jgi:NadR type nicotinamide-nucleotide adenylyltransferase
MKRIAIIGPESTGKSELAGQLAREYETEWVPEYARFYLDRIFRPYEESDLLEIAKGQLLWEDDKASYAKNLLFCDTNLIVIKVWSDHKYGRTDPWILEQLERRQYDHYILSDIDLPWRPDPQREHPQMRKHFLDIYRKYLEDHQLPYSVAVGEEGDRLKSAIDGMRNNQIL